MATILRGLFVASRAPLRDATHVRQWVSAGLALLTAVVVAAPPFKQTDWPIAKAPQIPQASTALAGSLPLRTAQTLPFSAKDWPLPQRVNESSIARKWERANDLPRQLQQTLPFAATDWPLPRTLRVDSPIARRWERQNDLSRQLQQTLPYALRDWPLANLPKSPPPNLTAPGSLSLTTFTGGPYALSDWPLPRSADSPSARRWERVNDLPRQLQTTLPFAQVDWPLAEKVRLAPPETPPLNIAAIRTVVAVSAPFAQFDWPSAKRTPSRATALGPNRPGGTGTPAVAPQPFAYSDWGLAKKRPPRAPDTPPLNTTALQDSVAGISVVSGFIETVGSTLAVAGTFEAIDVVSGVIETIGSVLTISDASAPFAQFDWPLAKRLRPVAPVTPSTNIVPTVGPRPFAFFDWGLAPKAKASSPGAPFANLLAINTPPVSGAAVEYIYFARRRTRK